MPMKKADQQARRVAELEALTAIQDRIDRVARDLSAGKHRYAVIDAWALGRLLGVDFDDHGGWTRRCYVYRHELEDAGFDESSNGIDVCATALTASDGTEVCFEVSIDNSGEPFDAKSPYDLKDGRGFDADGMVQVD